MAPATLGVYLHVPFCERVCPYCDFAVVGVGRVGRAGQAGEAGQAGPAVRAARGLDPALERRSVDALLRELAARREDFVGLALETIYLGGGTPSLLGVESVARLVSGVRDAFGAAPAPALEVTLEVNPSTLERARLPGFREAGVNRLSIGVQSFDDAVLRRLGRAHRAGEAHATLAAARSAGFTNLSLDLIFAAPGQGLAQLERDLDAVVAFGPEHVSTYALTIEPGTPFARAAARAQLELAGEDESIAMFERIEVRLGDAGLARYEISSFARPGFASRHNRRYWERTPVLGLGVGAVSSDPPGPGRPHGERRTNPRALAAWLERVEAGVQVAEERERLDPATARGEAVFLALRTLAGLDAEGFRSEFGAPPRAFFGEAIDALAAAGLLAEESQGNLALTRAGRLLADTVFERFVGGDEPSESAPAIDAPGPRW